MKLIRSIPLLVALLVPAASALAHSFNVGNLHIDHPFARPTVPHQPAAGVWMTIENRGKTADSLVSATSPIAREVQLHTMTLEGNVMRMREVDRIDIKRAAKVRMVPGEGYHLMLIGLKQPLAVGQTFPMQLKFEKAGQVEVTVNVEEIKPGAESRPHGHGHGHGH